MLYGTAEASVRRLPALVCTATIVLSAAEPVGRRETNAEYKRSLIGKRAAIGAVAHATIGEIRNSPHEWGRGVGGFAKRTASAFGQHAVKDTIQFGVATWHHEDLHYRRSNLQGTWPRVQYAIKTTFVVPRTDRPGHTVALGRLSGSFGSGIVSRAWQPASAAGLGAGIASGGISLGAEVAVNVAREFWPRKKKFRETPLKRSVR